MKKIAKINKNMKIADVIRNFPQTGLVFLKYGLHCIGCPMSAPETIEEAAKLHQIEIKKFISDLNKTIMSNG